MAKKKVKKEKVVTEEAVALSAAEAEAERKAGIRRGFGRNAEAKQVRKEAC